MGEPLRLSELPAFNEGVEDYFAAKSFDANPYERGTPAYDAWQLGWLDAEEGDSD